jgi:hypothetical protein
VADLARLAGQSLATLHPHVAMICGGLGGVMNAAAHGMTEGGGISIGLIPEVGTPSAWLTFAVRTGLPANHRNIVTASASDLLVVLPGSHGTLIEGWTGADLHVPLVAVGNHAGSPTQALPFTTGADAADLAGLVVKLLGLPPGVG